NDVDAVGAPDPVGSWRSPPLRVDFFRNDRWLFLCASRKTGAAMADRNTFYITTPIYYPNGDPHLGSVYTTVLADVLARYHRLLGEPIYFLTGTDEHGTKMAKAAEKEGADPQSLADKYARVFVDTWRELKI